MDGMDGVLTCVKSAGKYTKLTNGSALKKSDDTELDHCILNALTRMITCRKKYRTFTWTKCLRLLS